jgi:hypothetical protein
LVKCTTRGCDGEYRIIKKYRIRGVQNYDIYCPRCNSTHTVIAKNYDVLELFEKQQEKRQALQRKKQSKEYQFKQDVIDRARYILRREYQSRKITELTAKERFEFEKKISDHKRQVARYLRYDAKELKKLERDITERERKAFKSKEYQFRREVVAQARAKLTAEHPGRKLTDLTARERHRFENEMSDIKRQIADNLNFNKEERGKLEKDISKREEKTFAKTGVGRAHATSRGEGYGKYAKKIAPALALFIVGLVSVGFGTFFFFGFLSLSLFMLVPPARYIKVKSEAPLGLNTFNPFHSDFGGTHVTFGFIRSFFKISAIFFFAWGFQMLGPNFNSLFVATLVGGYFLLAREYDPKIQSEYLESLMRFFVGCYISIWVFGTIFQSLTLGALALAFFAVPPIPKKGIGNISEVLSRGLSGFTTYWEMFDKLVFSILMIVSLSGALGFFGAEGWGLTGTLQATFIYFWVVCGIGGFFSPAAERPVTGTLMLGAGTIIYGVGPGSQIIGGGLFGDWWPTVNSFFNSVFEPISSAFGQIGDTFGNAFFMLTNPVGYATQMLNGSYTSNPTGGPTGAFGVEMTSFTVSDLYVTQPYVVTALLKNQGSQDAERIRMSLCSGLAGYDNTRTTDAIGIDYEKERVAIGKTDLSLGINRVNGELIAGSDYEFQDYDPSDFNPIDPKGETPNGCIVQEEPASGSSGVTLSEQETAQFIFSSDNGIGCKTVIEKGLRQRSIPFIAKVTYEYDVHSTLQMEFMKLDEWRAQAETINSVQVNSEMTTSPTKLSIGTVNQPIITGQTPFYIGLKLQSAEGDESKIEWADVELVYPMEFGKPVTCTGICTNDFGGGKECKNPGTEGENYVLRWEHEDNPVTTGTLLFYCSFNKLEDASLDGPTKTYVVTADASFGFSRWDTKSTLIQFGGVQCCRPGYTITSTRTYERCGEGKVCDADTWTCGAGTAPSCSTLTSDQGACEARSDCEFVNDACLEKGALNFCSELNQAGGDLAGKCGLGRSGCQDSTECGGSYVVAEGGDANAVAVCRKDIGSIPNGVCCPTQADPEQCIAAYNSWASSSSGYNIESAKNALLNAGTDCDDIGDDETQCKNKFCTWDAAASECFSAS